jgi:outer membrane protein OmpA-like peptidoglycan-associated protein
MKVNPDIHIELFSHTDSRSSKTYNLTLSQKRAKAAVRFLISKGVVTSRISGIGFGEIKLINRCKDEIDCTEQEHAQNRRTEFKITRKK